MGSSETNSIESTMKNVRIKIDMGYRGQFEVCLDLDDSVTCGETLRMLLDSLELRPHDKRGRWQLVESWRGCGEYTLRHVQCLTLANIYTDRVIPAKEQMVPLYASTDRGEINVCLKRRPLPFGLKDKSSKPMSLSTSYGLRTLLQVE